MTIAILPFLLALHGLAQTTVGRVGPVTPELVVKGSIPSQYHVVLAGLGSRVQTAGSERSIYTGTLQSGNANSTTPLQVTRELSGNFRIDTGSGVAASSIIFDGTKLGGTSATLSAAENSLAETLIADSADYFFYSVAFGQQACRLLGRRYRTDNGTDPKYTGPFYDIYELVRKVDVRSDGAGRLKHYYFDSVSGLLQKVRYLTPNGAAAITVDVAWSGWQKQGEQFVPGTVTRTENGTAVYTYRVATVRYAPKQADGTFVVPVGGK